MKRLSIFCLSAFALVSLAAVMTQASDPPAADKKIAICCPVVGFPETKSCCCPSSYCSFKAKAGQAIEHQGAKLLFCCGKCAKMFKETPAKFAVGANHQLVATGQARQEKCPLGGGKVDSSIFAEVQGVKVSFCSEEARKKVANASPVEQLNLVFGTEAFARGFVIQGGKK
jgi:YHS domain-containing protein